MSGVKDKSTQGSDGSDEPLISTQEFNDISSQNNDIKTEELTKNQLSGDVLNADIEWFDEIGVTNSDEIRVQKIPEVRHDSSLVSQEAIVHTMDDWKGCSVINYKTFKKFSQNSSQTNTQPLIRLKKVENNSHKNGIERQCDDKDVDNDFNENEKGFKRKLDSETTGEKRIRNMD